METSVVLFFRMVNMALSVRRSPRTVMLDEDRSWDKTVAVSNYHFWHTFPFKPLIERNLL